MSIALYRGLTWVGGPLIRCYMKKRLKSGREDPKRREERMGIPSAARPDGKLILIHAASVGESLSVLPIVRRLRTERPEISILITSGTLTSARILSDRLPEGIIHQYIPVDRVPWVKRFLNHWRPDLVLWIESEFWPTLLSEVRRRNIPAILVNARISSRSWRGWRRAPWMIRQLLATFEICMAQTELYADRLRNLGALRVACPGNLKFAADILPASDDAVAALESDIAARPRWVAVSTHPGEEEAIANAHLRMARNIPDLLTIIAPRHPARGPQIAAMLRERGLAVCVRSLGERVTEGTDVLLADTIGEMGIFFRVTDIAFIGGSLIPHGGQNPIEPARMGCAIVHGPHMENFLAVEVELRTAGASETVTGAEELSRAVGTLLSNPGLRQRRIAAARTVGDGKAGVLDAVFYYLDPVLNRISPASPIPATRDASA